MQQGLEDVARPDPGIGGDREAELARDREAEAVGSAAGAPHLQLRPPRGQRAVGEDRQRPQALHLLVERDPGDEVVGARSRRAQSGRAWPGAAASALASRAPVGGAVGVALAARGDRAAAARAGALAAFVDLEVVAAAALDRAQHLLAGGEQDAPQLLVGEVADRPPGVDAGGEAGLALEDVADAGDQVLVEQGVAEAAGRGRRAAPRIAASGSKSAARMSGPSRVELGIAAQPRGRPAPAGSGRRTGPRPSRRRRAPPRPRRAAGASGRRGGRSASRRSSPGGCAGRARRSRAAGACRAPRPLRACGRRAARSRPLCRAGSGALPPRSPPRSVASKRRASRRIVSPSATPPSMQTRAEFGYG